MDLKKYDELKKKNNKKDFETSNSGLDWWLFRLSYLGNILSIFFSIFLVYPGLLKAIEINIIGGAIGKLISFTITFLILVAFEVIKRYVVKNYSNEYVRNKMVLASTGWLVSSITILLLSFWLSVIGSKNLGSISVHEKTIVENKTNTEKNIIDSKYSKIIDSKNTYIVELIEINKGLSEKMDNTPIGWESIKNGYRKDINVNDIKINETKKELDVINLEYKNELSKLESKQLKSNDGIDTENISNVILFIIIAIVSEVFVFIGIYFREWYEYKLLQLGEQRFEKFYVKRDRYKALITFVYNNGKAIVGDKVITGLELKELIKDKTTLQPKFADEFLKEMDNLGVFNIVGKRRFIQMTYEDALNTIENYDDTYRILENIK